MMQAEPWTRRACLWVGAAGLSLLVGGCQDWWTGRSPAQQKAPAGVAAGAQGGATGAGQASATGTPAGASKPAHAAGGGAPAKPATGRAATQVPPRGTVAGVVRAVNVPAGELRLATARGNVLLRGRPGQLAGLRTGERFRATFEDFGGRAPWLVRSQGAAPASRAFGPSGRATGVLAGLDAPNGRLVLDEQGRKAAFQADPAQLRRLRPGETLIVQFQSIGGVAWAEKIDSPAPPTR
jgi:hypothetical protein